MGLGFPVDDVVSGHPTPLFISYPSQLPPQKRPKTNTRCCAVGAGYGGECAGWRGLRTSGTPEARTRWGRAFPENAGSPAHPAGNDLLRESVGKPPEPRRNPPSPLKKRPRAGKGDG